MASREELIAAELKEDRDRITDGAIPLADFFKETVSIWTRLRNGSTWTKSFLDSFVKEITTIQQYSDKNTFENTDVLINLIVLLQGVLVGFISPPEDVIFKVLEVLNIEEIRKAIIKHEDSWKFLWFIDITGSVLVSKMGYRQEGPEIIMQYADTVNCLTKEPHKKSFFYFFNFDHVDLARMEPFLCLHKGFPQIIFSLIPVKISSIAATCPLVDDAAKAPTTVLEIGQIVNNQYTKYFTTEKVTSKTPAWHIPEHIVFNVNPHVPLIFTIFKTGFLGKDFFGSFKFHPLVFIHLNKTGNVPMKAVVSSIQRHKGKEEMGKKVPNIILPLGGVDMNVEFPENFKDFENEQANQYVKELQDLVTESLANAMTDEDKEAEKLAEQ